MPIDIGMSPIKKAALILLIIALILTGFGGWMDMSYNQWQLTRDHIWNDGLFLGIVAIALLVWSK